MAAFEDTRDQQPKPVSRRVIGSKIVAITGSVLLVGVVYGVMSGLIDFEGLLPESKEVIHQRYMHAVQLEGEVKELAIQLSVRESALKNRIGDAENEVRYPSGESDYPLTLSAPDLALYRGVYELSQFAVYQSNAFVELQDAKSQGEAMMLAKEYAQAIIMLGGAKLGYEGLLSKLDMVEPMYLAQGNALAKQKQWGGLKSKYNITPQTVNPSVNDFSDADVSMVFSLAESQRDRGELNLAKQGYQQAVQGYQVLIGDLELYQTNLKAAAVVAAAAKAAAKAAAVVAAKAAAKAAKAAKAAAAAAAIAKAADDALKAEEYAKAEAKRQEEMEARLLAEAELKKIWAGNSMISIPAGSFRMGDLQGVGQEDEKPLHRVSVKAFALSKTEVTFAQYDVYAEAVGKAKPDDEGWGRGNRPVMNVSWNDAVAYTQWLSEKTGEHIRLPSESEWEYVARAGGRTQYSWGDDPGRNGANCDGCGSQWDNRQTAPVGTFKPNGFGLYDMHGNVWEWTLDCWNESYDGAPNDGSAWKEGDCSKHVLRGGSTNLFPRYMRSANRFWNTTRNRNRLYGFRLARDPT